MAHDVGEAFRQIDVAQEPDDAVEEEVLHGSVEIELDAPGYPIVEAVDLGIERGHPIAVAHGGERSGDSGRRGAGLIGDAHDERRPAAIDHRIPELRGDDFAAQPMMLERVGKTFVDRLGEVAAELAGEIRFVRHRRFQQILVE